MYFNIVVLLTLMWLLWTFHPKLFSSWILSNCRWKKLFSSLLWPCNWLHRYMILSNIINAYFSLGINFSDMVSHFLSQLKCSIPVSVCLLGKLRYAVEVLVHAFSSCLKILNILCPWNFGRLNVKGRM